MNPYTPTPEALRLLKLGGTEATTSPTLWAERESKPVKPDGWEPPKPPVDATRRTYVAALHRGCAGFEKLVQYTEG